MEPTVITLHGDKNLTKGIIQNSPVGSRLTHTDFFNENVSEGNPGCATAYIALIMYIDSTQPLPINTTVDPSVRFNEMAENVAKELLNAGLVGSKVWIVYKDQCKQDAKVFYETLKTDYNLKI